MASIELVRETPIKDVVLHLTPFEASVVRAALIERGTSGAAKIASVIPEDVNSSTT